MRVSVRHVSHYRYEPPAERVAMRLKLYPSQHDGQRRIEWRVSANGAPVPPILTSGFGDEEGLWIAPDRSSSIEIVAEGVVEAEDCAGVVTGLPANPPAGVFLRDTPLTLADATIAALAAEAEREEPLEELHALGRLVKARVAYERGATDAATTAAKALSRGAGVCQDHAQIFIAAARVRGHPARYVAGYLMAGEAGAEVFETHAWAEAFVKGLGWVGFDPSHGISPTDRYVRLACGLDAAGAAPIRGSVLGGAQERMTASVAISQLQQ